MENREKKRIAVALDEVSEALLQERIEYLQARRPGSKVTISDAIRHALNNTDYKKGNKKEEA